MRRIPEAAGAQKSPRHSAQGLTWWPWWPIIQIERALRQAVSPKSVERFQGNRHPARWRFLLFTIIVTVNRPICNVIRIGLTPLFGDSGEPPVRCNSATDRIA